MSFKSWIEQQRKKQEEEQRKANEAREYIASKNKKKKAENEAINTIINAYNKQIDIINKTKELKDKKSRQEIYDTFKNSDNLNTLNDYQLLFDSYNKTSSKIPKVENVKYKERVDLVDAEFNMPNSAIKEKEYDDRTAKAKEFINSNAQTYKTDKSYDDTVKKGYETLNKIALFKDEYANEIKPLNQNQYSQEEYTKANTSQVLKDNYAYIVGKYGQDSKEAKDALDQINYKYGQEYEQGIADKKLAEIQKQEENPFYYIDTPEYRAYYDNIRKEGKNAELVIKGFKEGAKDVFTGIKTSFDVLQDHVTTPQVVNHNRIVWETELSKSPQSVQTLASVSRAVGNIGTIVATSLLTGGYGGAVAANVTMGVSVFGNQFDSNIKEGKGVMESIEHAALTAGSEVLLTQIFGKIIGTVRGLSTSEPLIKQTISKLSLNPKAQAMLDSMGRMLGEGTEEYVQQILTPVFRNIAFNEDNEFKIYTPEAVFAFLMGAITAGFIDTVNLTSIKVKNGENNTQFDLVKQIAENKLNMSKYDDSDNVVEAVSEELSGEQLVAFNQGLDVAQEVIEQQPKVVPIPNANPSDTTVIPIPNAIPSQTSVKPLNATQSEENTPTQASIPIENKTAVSEKVTTNQNIVNTENKSKNTLVSEIENIKNRLIGDREHREEVALAISKFHNTLVNKKDLNTELHNRLVENEKIKYYEVLNNNEAVNEAVKDLANKDIATETENWLNLDKKKISLLEINKGWVLADLYQKAGQNELAETIFEHLGVMEREGGRAIQIVNYWKQMSPQTKVIWAEKQLSKLKADFLKNQTLFGKNLATEKDLSKFKLSDKDKEYILQRAELIQQNKADDKIVEQYELDIQRRVYENIPTTWRRKLRSWTRISMLANPKTMVRNVVGNVATMPFRLAGDVIGSAYETYLYKSIQKTTDLKPIRTTSPSMEGFFEGGKQGVQRIGKVDKLLSNDKYDTQSNELIQDFGDNAIGKVLNKFNRWVNLGLDAGDRPIAYAYYNRSLKNQMRLNKVDKPTRAMTEIAVHEAMEATYQDSNAVTNLMGSIVRTLNGGKEFGFGTIMQPFVKTPANLTKTMLQYSPLGFIEFTSNLNKFNKSIEAGQYDALLQKKLVNSFSKAVIGSIMNLGIAILKELGLITGAEDKDKDVANYQKYVLGIQPYSIKIGDHWYSYSWLQPIGSNVGLTYSLLEGGQKGIKGDEKNRGNNGTGGNLPNAIVESLSEGSNLLFEQTIFKSIQTLMASDNITMAILDVGLQLPVQATPTLLSQISQVTDDVQRITYAQDEPLGNTARRVLAKLPIASKTLAPNVNTIGNEVKKYGGYEQGTAKYLFNVFLNPNTSCPDVSTPASKELYNLYKETNDKTVIPRTAPYTVSYTVKGKKYGYALTTQERSTYQKTIGKGVNKAVESILNNSQYKSLTAEEKVGIANDIMDYYAEEAKKQVVEGYGDSYEYSTANEKVRYAQTTGLSVGEYMVHKYKISKFNATNSDGKKEQGLKKKRVAEYLNSTNLTYRQKLLLFGLNGYSLTNSEKSQMVSYLNSLNLSTAEKQDIFNKLQIK